MTMATERERDVDPGQWPAIRVAAVVSDGGVRRRVAVALADLGVRHWLATVDDAAGATLGASVAVVDVGARSVLRSFPGPAIVLADRPDDPSGHGRLTDPVLRVADLQPVELLRLMATSVFAAANAGRSVIPGGLPVWLVSAYLAQPRRLSDFRSWLLTSGGSARAARRLVKEVGYARFDLLTGRVRAEVAGWLSACGVRRTVAFAYLGIADPSNFRRSCLRAGVRPPVWRQGARR
jgi:hypothetical protein